MVWPSPLLPEPSSAFARHDVACCGVACRCLMTAPDARVQMRGNDFRDIVAFLAVARVRSFTRAAAQLGVSQSALSHTIRALESRRGSRLLTRTPRSVSPTEAGERLIRNVEPRFKVISDELSAFHEQRGKPMGTVRITTSDFAANTVLWPKLSKLQPRY